jgi:hypothetical protein
MASAKRLTLIISGVITCLLVVSQLHTLAMSKLISAESSQVKIAYDQQKNETTESIRIISSYCQCKKSHSAIRKDPF